MDIKYLGFDSQETEADVRYAFDSLIDFVPEWMQEVTILYDRSIEEDNMNITVDYEYRRSFISVSNHWLALDDIEGRKIMLHEISHMHLASLDFIEEQIDENIKKVWLKAIEGCTQDITHAFWRNLKDAAEY